MATVNQVPQGYKVNCCEATREGTLGYKQTEVGDIPEDWNVSKVEDVAKVVDSLHQTPGFSTEGYPMVRVTDIKTGNLNLDMALKVSEPVFREFIKNYAPKKNDIVLSRVGSYGVSSFVDTDEPFCMGQNTVVIQPNIPARYLYYVLNSRGTRQQIDDGSYGSGYKSLSLKNVKELLVPVPSLPTEQRAIATALSDVDALLAAQDKLIAKKRDIKQAAMQQLLTGKQRLPGFTGEWEVKQLGDVSHIKTGKKNNEDKIEEGAYPFFVRSQTVERINSYCFDGEAILVPGEGNIGSIFHYINGKFDYHQRVYKISDFNADMSGKFVYFCMVQTFYNHAMSNSVKATVDSLRLPTFLEFVAPPTIDEQTAIATILSDMDADLATLEQQRDKTRALKQGMMQELLTGRIRLV